MLALLRGEEGVRAFYDSAQFVRKNAMPSFVSGPLFGKGAPQYSRLLETRPTVAVPMGSLSTSLKP